MATGTRPLGDHGWLGLGRDPARETRWELVVEPRICGRTGYLHGGCSLAAASTAMEAATGRPLVWATAQYLAYAEPPSVLDIDVTAAVSGRSITQARATGHVGATEIVTVNAALGDRDLDVSGSWAEPPKVPDPDPCEVRPPRVPGGVSIETRLDMRLADARAWDEVDGHPSPDGRSALWVRVPDMLDLSSGAGLAILGDYVPFGIGQALGRQHRISSLDNTLRVYRLVPTEWVLLDIRVQAVARGFGHGIVHLWSEDRALLATASQSTIVRSARF